MKTTTIDDIKITITLTTDSLMWVLTYMYNTHGAEHPKNMLRRA